MSELIVRAYNVRFGDALLVSIPDRDPRSGNETIRHLLIDVGNVLGGRGGDEQGFRNVIRDIRKQTGTGKPVDLYIMTHEHLDHVKGVLHADRSCGLPIRARYAWLTASSSPEYYKTHRRARKKRLQMGAFLKTAPALLRHLPLSIARTFGPLLANNDWKSTARCVDYIRRLATVHTSYVHRGFRPQQGENHPFREAELSLWAPEEDTSAYYGRLSMNPVTTALRRMGAYAGKKRLVPPEAPPGVDPQAMARLLARWNSDPIANLLAIDRASNNTSVVLSLKWRGWHLLFPGDAERKSWKMMTRYNVLEPIHFLKVGHHGSRNATPEASILDRILPLRRTDGRRRVALLSTCSGVYSGVPHRGTITQLRKRCDQIYSTAHVDLGKPVVIRFPG